VLATIYKKEHSALVSIASWAKDDVSVKLQINWKALASILQKLLYRTGVKNFSTSSKL